MDDLPTVRIPVTLASPSTNSAVVPTPICTVPTPVLLKVDTPLTFKLVASSLVIVDIVPTILVEFNLVIVPTPVIFQFLPVTSSYSISPVTVSYTHLTLPTIYSV